MLNFITKENAEKIIKTVRGENIVDGEKVYNSGFRAFINYEDYVKWMKEHINEFTDVEEYLDDLADECGSNGSTTYEVKYEKGVECFSLSRYVCCISANKIKCIWEVNGEDRFEYLAEDFSEDDVDNENYDEQFDIFVF